MTGTTPRQRDDELIAAWAAITGTTEGPGGIEAPQPAVRSSLAPAMGTLAVVVILVAGAAVVRLGVEPSPEASTPAAAASRSPTVSPSRSPTTSTLRPPGVELLPSTTRTPECTHHDRQWIVRIESGERFWDLFPATSDIAELRQVEEPLLVSTYPAGWKIGTTGMGTSPSLESGAWAVCVAVESGQETLFGGTASTHAVSPAGSFLLDATEPSELRPGALALATVDTTIATGHTGHGEQLGTINAGERVFILDEERPDRERWYRVQYSGDADSGMIVGWVEGAALAPADAICPADVTVTALAPLPP